MVTGIQGTTCASPIKTQNEQPQKPKLNIALIDIFKKTYDSGCIDWDDLPDVSHGDITKRIIQEGLPNAEIDCFGESMIGSLDEILKNIHNGKKYDALNLSCGIDNKFSELSKAIGKPITSENISENIDEVKKLINRSTKDKHTMQLKQIIEKLDEIADTGTKVYIAAGNERNKRLNLLTLSKKNNSVGALDLKGKKARFSNANSLVNKWEIGVFKIKQIKDSNGKIGFDYTGDGSIDIYADQTTAHYKRRSWKGIRGTSFSCPTALVNDLKEKEATN